MPRVRSLISWCHGRARDERGAVMVVVAVLLPLLLISTALAIDLSTMQQAKEQAQAAADAGALAGAGDVGNGTATSAATTDADAIARKNDAGISDAITTPYNGDPDQVSMTVNKTIPLSFAGLFGIKTGSVSATAIATSDLGTPLGYFGSSRDDLQDGSSTSDGWDNFCANNTADSPTASPADNSNSKSNSSDPPRCPAGAAPENSELDGWIVAHGGIDIATTDQFYASPDGGQMVDLTGTCVEANGSYPSPQSGSTSITVSGTGTTSDDGYCENNSDGEIEESITTAVGQLYKVTFNMGSNTWGYPYEKSIMAVASNVDLETLPPMADTDGDSSYQSGNTSETYGTVYPLETNSSWPSWGGKLVAHEQFFYNGPTGGRPAVNWAPETFTFTATSNKTWIGFGALTNCVGDWTAANSLNPSYFYPSSAVGDSPGSYTTPASTTGSFVSIPQEVHADKADDSSGYYDQCKYGPGISDVSISGSSAVALSG